MLMNALCLSDCTGEESAGCGLLHCARLCRSWLHPVELAQLPSRQQPVGVWAVAASHLGTTHVSAQPLPAGPTYLCSL